MWKPLLLQMDTVAPIRTCAGGRSCSTRRHSRRSRVSRPVQNKRKWPNYLKLPHKLHQPPLLARQPPRLYQLPLLLLCLGCERNRRRCKSRKSRHPLRGRTKSLIEHCQLNTLAEYMRCVGPHTYQLVSDQTTRYSPPATTKEREATTISFHLSAATVESEAPTFESFALGWAVQLKVKLYLLRLPHGRHQTPWPPPKKAAPAAPKKKAESAASKNEAAQKSDIPPPLIETTASTCPRFSEPNVYTCRAR